MTQVESTATRLLSETETKSEGIEIECESCYFQFCIQKIDSFPSNVNYDCFHVLKERQGI